VHTLCMWVGLCMPMHASMMCVGVCVCVCMYVCMHVGSYVYMHACMCDMSCMHTYDACAYRYVCMHVCMYACVCDVCGFVCIYASMYDVCGRLCACICVSVGMYVCMHVTRGLGCRTCICVMRVYVCSLVYMDVCKCGVGFFFFERFYLVISYKQGQLAT
jgi:hypothetical protein